MYHLITASMTQSRYHSFSQYSNVKIFYSAAMLAVNTDSIDNSPLLLNPFSLPLDTPLSSLRILKINQFLTITSFPSFQIQLNQCKKKKNRKTRYIVKGFIVLINGDGRWVNLDKSVAVIVDKMATTRAQLAQNNNQIVCLECYLEFCNIFSHKQCELIIY